MSLGRGTGLLVESAEVAANAQRAAPLGALLGGTAVSRPARVSYVALMDQTIDQGGTNSCVGVTFSTCLFLRAKLAGSPIARPSAKLIYDLARLRADPNAAMHDVGCYPLDAVATSGEHGLVPWEAWPLFEHELVGPDLQGARVAGKEWIDTPPDVTVFYQAIDARVVGYLRADAGDVVAQLEAALVIGQIPGFGMLVRGDYGDVRGDEVYDVPTGLAPAPDLGGHMQACVGFDEESFHIASSWGPEHGENGIVRVAKRFVADRRWCFSRTVITSAPLSLAA